MRLLEAWPRDETFQIEFLLVRRVGQGSDDGSLR
ncbi:hypothetical protein CLV30_11453 [Haloactinopolyspora alba]|uniref:Uncharacterized protein n=1 Tax=Haloactinopolyspora alba TaxID=648780 RepID=A0A2P8DVR3_9ACTN|nr:hypothetical protein CLV30_11453 [Haloactinopolyspora alba]